jgi:hypothetical protein
MNRRSFLKASSGLFVPAVLGLVGPDAGILGRRRVAAGYTCPPTDFSGLIAWWKADSLSLSNGDPVSSWTDSSGNGNTATASLTLRPTYTTNVFGTQPGVVFDAVNDAMSFPDINLGVAGMSTIPFTIIFIGFVTADAIILGGSAANVQFRKFRSSAETISKYFGVSDQSSSAFATAHNAVHMSVWKRTGGSGFFRENKTARGTFTEEAVFYDTIINRIGQTTFGVLSGSVAEICIWNQELSTANCDCMYDGYFKPKWGLP